jgi:hypothetical protein
VSRGKKPRHTIARVSRSIGLSILTVVAALVIGFTTTPLAATGSLAPASNGHHGHVANGNLAASLFNDQDFVPYVPVTLGMRLIDAIAEAIANVVEVVSTPPPIAIPAPRAT